MSEDKKDLPIKEKATENIDFEIIISNLIDTQKETQLEPKREYISLSVLDEYSNLHFKMPTENSNRVRSNSDISEFGQLNLDLEIRPVKINRFKERLLKNDHNRPKPIRTLLQELKK